MTVNKKKIYELNVEGKYYVNSGCIACAACVIIAPAIFEMNDDEGHAFVKKQPTTKEELDICKDLYKICPGDAIGRDGNSK